MKKIFLSLVMLAAMGQAFAQTPEEKAAKKAAEKLAKSQVSQGVKLRDEILTLYQANQAEQAKGEKANADLIGKNEASIKTKALEANEVLQTALHGGNVPPKQMFEASKALDDVSSQLLNPELNKAAAKQTFDTLAFAKAVDGVCKGCYGVITYGNKKDELQKPAILNSELKMPKLMTYYAYLCLFYTESKNINGAAAALDKYANFATDYPAVANEETVKNPEYPVSQFAFNLYYTAYTLKDYANCEKYYQTALEYPDEQSHNFVVSSYPQMFLSKGDTVRWVSELKSMIKADPNSSNAEVATQNLLAYYGKQGPQPMSAFADEILTAFPNNKIANYGKGYSLFAQEKYEEALPFFQKSVEVASGEYLDGNFMCGMSLYREALENYYKHIDSKKYKTAAEMTAAEDKYVKSYFRKAQTYFEKCRELAPEKAEDWAGPLQNIYKNLGDTVKAKEMADLLK